MHEIPDAAQRWSDRCGDILIKAGFVSGLASPCDFSHQESTIYMVVHGDDFMFVFENSFLQWCEQLLKSHYTCKSILVGPGAGCVQEVRIFSRIVTYLHWGIQYESDPVLAERLIRDCGLEHANAVVTPWSSDAAFLEATADPADQQGGFSVARQSVGSQRHLEPIVAQMNWFWRRTVPDWKGRKQNCSSLLLLC